MKNPRSKNITQGVSRAPNRAMLRGVGMQDEDFEKSLIGIASGWSDITPCNAHLNALGEWVEKGIKKSGGYPQTFGYPTASDGIWMGHEGMRYSLPSREIIADSIDLMAHGQSFDGMVGIGGCDKNMPGNLMGMLRINIPSVFLYGGTISPGKYKGEDVDIVSIFEAVGKFLAKKIDQEELAAVEKASCPTYGACGGMYTANSMASAIEALGMALPYSASIPAVTTRRKILAENTGKVIVNLVEKNITPRQIATKKAFENAIVTVFALGGSTNLILHLLAMAYEGEVDLTLDDFNRLGEKIPHIADLKPGGKYVMEDLDAVGGVAGVMKLLLEKKLLHGDCLTVTGENIRENLEKCDPIAKKQTVILGWETPLKKTAPVKVLKGNLAPEGAIIKTAGLKVTEITGPAKVFECEEDCFAAIEKGEIKKGEIIVIRNEGPKGGPGMREMLSVTGLICGQGMEEEIGLITDGRFSGGSHGLVVGHVAPEAYVGGPIAAVQNGDQITISEAKSGITLHLSDEEITQRLKSFTPKKDKYNTGFIGKYRKLVQPASLGAITNFRNYPSSSSNPLHP